MIQKQLSSFPYTAWQCSCVAWYGNGSHDPAPNSKGQKPPEEDCQNAVEPTGRRLKLLTSVCWRKAVCKLILHLLMLLFRMQMKWSKAGFSWLTFTSSLANTTCPLSSWRSAFSLIRWEVCRVCNHHHQTVYSPCMSKILSVLACFYSIVILHSSCAPCEVCPNSTFIRLCTVK